MLEMLMVIKAIGLIMAVMGIAFIAIPKDMVKIMPFFKKSKRIYIVGVIRLVLAVIFLLSASQCRWPWVIGVLGILTLVSGVLIFVLKLKVIRGILDRFSEKSDMFLRITGVIIVVLGMLIVFAV